MLEDLLDFDAVFRLEYNQLLDKIPTNRRYFLLFDHIEGTCDSAFNFFLILDIRKVLKYH